LAVAAGAAAVVGDVGPAAGREERGLGLLAGMTGGVRGGDKLEAIDSGSPDRPIRCPASWLADHATAAVAMIPITAAASQNTGRRVTVIATYSAPG
jgi:hypothetical protein